MTGKVYNWAVDVLLDAYKSGKLEHGKCERCAVGNLLGHGMWGYLFVTETKVTFQWTCKYIDDKEYISEFVGDLKGFTMKELMSIEFAFENAIKHDYENIKRDMAKKGQYLGLCAVLDYMKSQVTDSEDVNDRSNELRKIAKDRFLVKV